LSSTRWQKAALPPDIRAFGDLFAIVFGEADPPERVTHAIILAPAANES
jgi:hypothetical protein